MENNILSAPAGEQTRFIQRYRGSGELSATMHSVHRRGHANLFCKYASLHRELHFPRPKAIPRFLILALNVLAFTPSTSAAPPFPWILPFVRSRTYLMWRAITSSINRDSLPKGQTIVSFVSW